MLNTKARARIANRIIFLVIALELVSIAIWGSVTYISSRQELLNTIRSRLSEATLRMETEINQFFLPIRIQAQVIADQLYARRLEGEEATPLLNQILRARPEILELGLIGRDGVETKHVSRFTSPDVILGDAAKEKIIAQAFAGRVRLGTIKFTEYNEPIIPMTIPVGPVGDVQNVLLLQINLRWLWTLIQKQKIGQTGYVYVADVQHGLIGHNDPSLVFSGFSLDQSDIPSDMFYYSLDNSSRLGIYRNFQNIEVAGVGHFDTRNNWWIFVELPTVEGLAPLQRMIHKFIFIFAFAAIFTVSAVLIFSRISLRPLDNFLANMGRLAAGERHVRFDVPEKSELAFLARGFNAMAQALDERIADLIDSESKLRASQEQYKTLNSQLRTRIDEATHELIDANRKLENTALEADAANKAKSAYVANMSHELRTPLNAILGYSEYLVGEMGANANPEWVELLGRINTSGKHLLQLIGNILDLSKIEAGKFQLNLEFLAIPDLIKAITNTISPLSNKKNNRFVVTCPDYIEKMETDSLRLQQVLINLLGNACKFTENGVIELLVSTHYDGGKTGFVSTSGTRG